MSVSDEDVRARRNAYAYGNRAVTPHLSVGTGAGSRARMPPPFMRSIRVRLVEARQMIHNFWRRKAPCREHTMEHTLCCEQSSGHAAPDRHRDHG